MGGRRLLAVAGLLLVLATVTTGRIRLVNHLRDQGHFDKYLHFSGKIARGEIPRERLGDLSPGYVAVVAALEKATGAGVRPLRAAQIAGVSVVALLAGFAATRVAGRLAGFFAGLLVLGNRAALVNATEIEPETLILILNSLALALLLSARGKGERGRARRLFLAGLALGTSAACRPIAVLPAAALGAWLFAIRRHDPSPASPGWWALGAAGPIAAVLITNLLLAGHFLLMNPGTVFFEGMNPSATGCLGAAPRVVNDLEQGLPEPDSLHVAYRIVAGRALGSPPNTRSSNRYWTAKATAFARRCPQAALRLLARKIALAATSYETYDLATLWRKDTELRGSVWIPFGALLWLALAGGWLARERAGTTPLLIYVACYALTLASFYFSSRQRNPLLPALAALAGAGAAEIVGLFRSGRRSRALLTLLTVAAATGLSGLEMPVAREDRYAWTASESSQRALAQAREASSEGDVRKAVLLRAFAATWATGLPPSAPPAVLLSVARAELARSENPERRFDLALALERAGDWAPAESVLASLEKIPYRPLRGNTAVNSAALYRARALLRLGRHAEARTEVERAAAEAPGDPQVLALLAALRQGEGQEAGAAAASELLDRLHDPFSAQLARAQADWDLGKSAEALTLIDAVSTRLPEWERPRALKGEILSRLATQEASSDTP